MGFDEVNVNGLAGIRLHGPGAARATILHHGAHVTSWTTADGRERLFLSERAVFAAGKAIRGGVPIVFPQFSGRGSLPKHGFARLLAWEFAGAERTEGGDAIAEFVLRDDDATRATWPHAFEARLQVRLSAEALSQRLVVRNTDLVPWKFTLAFHGYLRVDGLDGVSVTGLEDSAYIDHVGGVLPKRADHAAIAFTGELDRVYPGATGPWQLQQRDTGLRITSEGCADVVVWNPGATLAASLPDLSPGDHARFVCVEPGSVEAPVELAPGAIWTGSQTFAAAPTLQSK